MKLVLSLAMAFGVSGSVYALDCSQGIGGQGFNSGYQSQSATLDILWNNYGDCYNHEDFLEAVEVPFASDSSSAFIQCRVAGMNAALQNKMVKISDECSWDARKAGDSTGLAVAQQFCQSSCWSAHYTVRSYTQQFKQACQASFTGYVQRYCSHKLNSQTFFDVRRSTCQL